LYAGTVRVRPLAAVRKPDALVSSSDPGGPASAAQAAAAAAAAGEAKGGRPGGSLGMDRGEEGASPSPPTAGRDELVGDDAEDEEEEDNAEGVATVPGVVRRERVVGGLDEKVKKSG